MMKLWINEKEGDFVEVDGTRYLEFTSDATASEDRECKSTFFLDDIDAIIENLMIIKNECNL